LGSGLPVLHSISLG